MSISCTAHVDNVGRIGSFPSRVAAVRAIRETLASSGRADWHGFVEDEHGHLIYEIGRPDHER